ncbi:hypothetical protein CGH20_13800 [Vibrio parahaemolyticus]|uniref:hypothetical protein n=1 Tax=Vibrio parahaemolyticus TaxID=670 RepID=UPI00111DBE3E|nr:hypothetical protein [Vibrio parahaemolyticus]TON12185.1 hypothetical protein CGH63_08145 [Vibrio parahaemolyticus]TOO42488.1 hypothetical protein CGH39_09800 [Vibrio parahaemolyticus]TOP29934.1 hypothetical protein CGH20_13800 [Vibrio parahaemolyticus]
MSLSLILGAAKLAMEVGPAAIRGISSLFGGSETADKVADMVEQVDGALGMTKEQKEMSLINEMQKLPPESLVELERIKSEMQKEVTRRQELSLQDKQKEHEQTQLTIRNGDNAKDEYVRHTRPKMARQSFFMMVLYIVAMEFMKAKGLGYGADVYLALTIAAPAFAYLGLRTIDGFAPYSKSSGDKVSGVLKSMIKGR